MKKEFSKNWVSSKQPRKQRKYRYNAPLHIRQNFVSTNFNKELRKKYNKRSFPLRAGDSVKVMRGGFKGKTGKISKVDLKDIKVYIEGLKRKKSDGKEVQVPFKPSNLQIISVNIEDKKRAKIADKKISKNPKSTKNQ